MALWIHWFNAIWLLRSGFSRLSTFLWFVTAVAGFAVRSESLGVTSIIRALKLKPSHYNSLRDNFHSDGIALDALSALWTRVVLRLFNPVRVNGRLVTVVDGLKAPKSGKKMPGVKLLHQESDSNTKPEYIMGHSLQAVSLLCQADKSVFAVPLAARIHEGIVWSNRDQRTLLDKMLGLLCIVGITVPYYTVADAYYASAKMINGLLAKNNHLITRVRSNAVAYEPASKDFKRSKGSKKRGRPKVYGNKVKLNSLLKKNAETVEAQSPVYGETNVKIQYRSADLLWRPAGRVVRFVAVTHPTRGSCLLMSTDLSLTPLDIIQLYGLRFKIEHSFKQAVHVIGTFDYHFWMQDMKPLRRGNGNQYMHREPPQYREAIKRKMQAYHVYIQAGTICQGLLQYLAATFPALVWNSFGSWLRTIRPGIPPSEFVVANALRQTTPEFLLNCHEDNILAKFILDRQDTRHVDMFRMAA